MSIHVLLDACLPNHLGICAMIAEDAAKDFSGDMLETYASSFSQACIVVIRAADHASLILILCKSSNTVKWHPLLYEVGSGNVLDATGVGNAFLTGLKVSWSVEQDAVEAPVFSNVAASFAVNQIGLPLLHVVREQET